MRVIGFAGRDGGRVVVGKVAAIGELRFRGAIMLVAAPCSKSWSENRGIELKEAREH